MSLLSDPRWGEALTHLSDYLGNHVRVSVTALALGLVVSLPLAIAARKAPLLRGVLLGIASIVQTVPGLALLALFYPLLLALTAVTLAREMISQGAIGRLYYYKGSYLNSTSGYTSPETPADWHHFQEKGGYGALADLGTHAIDLARFLAGRRAPLARTIYRHLGGRSPILEETHRQAQALEMVLRTPDMDVRAVVAMSSCNVSPVKWAISPTTTAGWVKKASCNA